GADPRRDGGPGVAGRNGRHRGAHLHGRWAHCDDTRAGADDRRRGTDRRADGMNTGAEPYRNLERMMKPQTKRPKPQRFGRQAKTAVTMMAAATLLGGWNLVAHLDRAQAGAAPEDGTKEAPAAESNPASPTAGATLLPLPTLA